MSELILRCACGNRLRMRAEHAGRTGRCSRCSARITVPPASVFQGRAGTTLTPEQLQSLLVSATAESSDVWRAGQVVDGRYEVRRLLGEGTFGSVWHVWHREWRLDLAVKQLKRPSPAGVQRFQREAQAWIDLGLHPHVVTAWYVRQLEGVPYLFLEYCEGGSLASWIEQGRTRDLGTALDVAIQLCWGLAHCHQKGIVHRDFKPHNVLVTRDGLAKLTDFGAVKFAMVDGQEGAGTSLDLRNTIGGQLQGTPPYMPPEQWVRGGDLTPQADLYAFGVTLFEMLSGDYPIHAGEPSVAGWARAHGGQRPALLRERRPDLPESLEGLVDRCLAKAAGDRPGGAQEVAAALQDVYRGALGQTYPGAVPAEAELLADGLNNRAVSLLEIGRPGEAEKVWGQALEADPHHLEATYNLGLFRWRQGRCTDEELLQGLRVLKPLVSAQERLAYLMARAHLEGDDCESAITLLRGPGGTPAAEEARRALAEAERRLPTSRRCLETLQEETINLPSRSFICLSDDGRHALTGRDSSTQDRKLKWWDLEKGVCLRVFDDQHDPGVGALAVSADLRYALSADAYDMQEEQRLALWEVRTGRVVRTLAVPGEDEVRSVALSPDGRYAAAGSAAVTVWDTASGACLRTVEGAGEMFSGVCITRDGRHLLTAGRTLDLWELATGRRVRTFEETEYVDGISLGGMDGLALAVGAEVKLWELATGRCLKAFPLGGRPVAAGCLSRDGKLALLANVTAFELWDTETPRCLRTFRGHRDGVTALALSADGRRGLTGSRDYTLRCWELAGSGPAYRAPFELSGLHSSHAVLSDRARYRELITEAEQAMQEGAWGRAAESVRRARSLPGHERKPEALRCWTELYGVLPRRDLLCVWEGAPTGRLEGKERWVALPAGGRHAVSATDRYVVRVRDAQTGACLLTQEGHAFCQASADGQLALSRTSDNLRTIARTTGGYSFTSDSGQQLVVWELASGKILHAPAVPDRMGDILCLSGDGRHAVSREHVATRTATPFDVPGSVLVLWDLATGSRVRSFPGHRSNVSSVCFSRDGSRLVSGGERERVLRVWDVATGECLHTLGGQIPWVMAVGLSPDGRHALAGCGGGVCHLYDLQTGRCVRSLEGHGSEVTAVCFSADGRHAVSACGNTNPFVSGSGDYTVKLWELGTGRCLATLEGYTASIAEVAIHPDGQYLVSRDTGVRLWHLDWELDAHEPRK